MRSKVLASLAAVAALHVAPALADTGVVEWVNLDDLGAAGVSARPAPKETPGLPRAWVRFARSDNDAGSLITLTEFECRLQRYRVVKITRYAQPNFQGTTTDGGFTDWDYAIPGSTISLVLSLACDLPIGGGAPPGRPGS